LSLKFSYQRPLASESRDFKMSSESHILSSTKNFKKMGLFRRNKNNNKPLLRQIIDLVPPWILTSCTNTYKSDKGVSNYKTYDQYFKEENFFKIECFLIYFHTASALRTY